MKAAEYDLIADVIPKEGLAGKALQLPANPSFGLTTTKILRHFFP